MTAKTRYTATIEFLPGQGAEINVTLKVTRRNVGEIDAAGVMIDIAISGHTILVCIDGEAFAFSAYHAREIAAYLIKAADEVQSCVRDDGGGAS